MYTAIIVFIVIVCLLLALVVLIQNSKGGGLAAGFSSSQQIMGVRKTSDFLEKFTWGLAITLMVLSLAGNFMLPKQETASVGASSIQEQIDNATMPTAPSATPLPGAQQQQPAAQPQPAK
jgi:preprotein translocase subunit SecG